MSASLSLLPIYAIMVWTQKTVYIFVNIPALIFWLLYISYCILSEEHSRMWNLVQIFASMLCKWHAHIKVDLFDENLHLISSVVLNVSYELLYLKYSMDFNLVEIFTWIKQLRRIWVRHVCTQNFSLGAGGTDPEVIYNLCSILKVMPRYNGNTALLAATFTYIQIKLHIPWLTHLI